MTVSVERQMPEQREAPGGDELAAPGRRPQLRHRVLARAHDAVNRLTQPARQRVGLGEFLLNDAAATDRLQSRLYFGLAARLWAVEQQSEQRLEVLHAGFDAVPIVPRRVVELGCGAGASAREAAARWPGSEVRGYDASGRMVRAARRAGGPAVAFERAVSGDVDDAADLVLFCNYLPYPGVVRRLLPEGGYVLSVSSFQRRTGETLAAHWTAHGFGLVSALDVGDGCFELYELRTQA